jgi:hypothetical protein
MRLSSLLLLFPVAVAAQTAVESPRIGCYTDSRGALRLVYGIRANFVVSPPLAENVVSFSCSHPRVILVKTATRLLALDERGTELATLEVAAGPASFRNLTATLAESPHRSFLFLDGENRWVDQPPSDAEPLLPSLGHRSARICGDMLCIEGWEPVDLGAPPLHLESMSASWLHVATEHAHFALTEEAGKPALYALPHRGEQ